MDEVRRLERMLRKLDHYKTRFNEHNRAITFAQQKKKAINKEIEEFITISQRYNPKDLDFLVEVAELVIKARRALTYTYAMRFMMNAGPAKTQFFDHLQGELESSLEKLNKRNEEDWRKYIEQNLESKAHM
jgi:hypothetical protein